MSLNRQDDESALIARWKAGDLAAFEAVVQLHRDRVYGRALQMLSAREDAEEVTQDTFLKANKAIHQFRGEAALGSWLYQIVTHLAHNRYWYWRRRRRDALVPLHALAAGGDSGTAELALEDRLGDPQQHTVEAVQREELAEHIRAALPQLPLHYREVLYQRVVQGLPYETIADQVGVPVGTVKSRLARARKLLRACLQQDFDEAAA